MSISAETFFNPESTIGAEDEALFFSRLKMQNGTFKMTRRARLTDWDDALRPILQRRRGAAQEVLDIGVSTGITTFELSNDLRAQGISAQITATDLFIDAYIVPIAAGIQVLCDRDGWPLRYDVGGIGLRPWIRRLDYLTLACVPITLARRLVRGRLTAAIRSGDAHHVQMITRVPSRDERLRFVENDIMMRTPAFLRRFSFIRAANILNIGYFSREQLRTAVNNVRSYLQGEGALFLVTRTGRDGANDGTLFELSSAGRFSALTRVGTGSEIERIVLDV